jgi:hypothetical protein
MGCQHFVELLFELFEMFHLPIGVAVPYPHFLTLTLTLGGQA